MLTLLILWLACGLAGWLVLMLSTLDEGVSGSDFPLLLCLLLCGPLALWIEVKAAVERMNEDGE